MLRRSTVLLMSAASLITIYFGLYWILPAGNPQVKETAVQGVLDLSHIELESSGVIPLAGQWEFYPDQLLVPPLSNDVFSEARYVTVPAKTWTEYTDQFGDAVMKPFGTGTYRLTIKLPRSGQTLGIKTSNIRMSNKIYLDGHLLGQSGNPDAMDGQFTPGNTPYVRYFTPSSDTVEVIVQVANYNFANGGGIFRPIYLGTDLAIMQYREKALRIDWISMIAYLISALFCLGISLQQDKLRKSLLFLGIHSVFNAIFIATHGEKVLYSVYPSFSYEWFHRLQYLTGEWSSIFLLMYMFHTFRSFSSKRWVYSLLALGAVLSLMTFLLPQTINSSYEILHILYNLFVWIYMTKVFITASLSKTDEAVYIMVGTLSYIAHGFSYNLNVIGYIEASTVPVVFAFGFILMQIMILSRRFSKAYKETEALSQELVRVDRLKDEFLAKTTHEFKTPLHGIMAITESMLDDPDENMSQSQRNSLSLVHQTSKRLSRLVHDILDLSRLKQGHVEINLCAVDVRSSVQAVLDVFRFMVDEHRVRLVNLIASDVPPIMADEYRFQQMIYNLISNAVKYTKDGEITCSVEQRESLLYISIRDTGAGIAQEWLTDIFEPFHQVAVSSHLAGEGSTRGAGIGLSIVKELTEIQGGTIHVQSSLGAGSTFTVALPIATEHRDPMPVQLERQLRLDEEEVVLSRTPLEHHPDGDATILVVDDVDTNLKVLVDRLGREGYHVIAVRNGDEALAQLERRKEIDLALVDVIMPGMSGYELCAKIRKRYEPVELPVIILTAAIHEEEMQAAFHSGANDFLHKPFQMAELLFRIRSLLMLKQSSIEKTNMEVAFLQAQIKPHFLYNVFNTIILLTYKDVEQARKVLNHLTEYLRGSFEFKNTERSIPLKAEMDLVCAYIEIEKARFRNRIHVVWDVEETLSGMLLPPLLLQPMVENAIRHGISKKLEGGTVYIRGKTEDGMLRLEVEDNGVGMTKERLSKVLSDQTAGNGVGIPNIRKRLKQLYGTDLQVESHVNQGTVMTMYIPLKARR